MENEILEIYPIEPPFKLEEKIFFLHDDEGNQIGEPYSYNDLIEELKKISGINTELLGEKHQD